MESKFTQERYIVITFKAHSLSKYIPIDATLSREKNKGSLFMGKDKGK